jgi:hypothetical protein
MTSKVLRDLRFSLNQAPKLADDWYIGMLKIIKKTYEYANISFSVAFNFVCNLTRCRLGDVDMISHNMVFKIKRILYSFRVRLPPSPPS